jgi:benzoyl-CoA reductase/2-hydroxyglutaryl-CoA dehydratase subunit BcrC/BadD/HgdB
LPTPSKYHPSRRRDEFLLDLVTQRQANGVIFARQKFCDPHGFDFARVGAALGERGIAHMLLELEQAPQVGQMRTRIQAFLETVRN